MKSRKWQILLLLIDKDQYLLIQARIGKTFVIFAEYCGVTHTFWRIAMNQEFLKSLTEQTKHIFAPLQRYNQAMIENMEKVAEYQLSTLKNYSDMGLNQLKMVAQIDEKADISEIGSRQIAWLNSLSKTILDDAQRMAELGSEIKDSIEGIMRESMQTTVDSPVSKSADSKPKASK